MSSPLAAATWSFPPSEKVTDKKNLRNKTKLERCRDRYAKKEFKYYVGMAVGNKGGIQNTKLSIHVHSPKM